MIKLLKILLTGFLASLFFFPINISFLPGSNSKMLLAAIGLVLFLIDCAERKSFSFSKDFLSISLISIAMSLWALVITVALHTYDNTFTSYFMSFWVWTGGAYAVVRTIKAVHGEVTVELIGNYLIGVCVFQCAMALGANYSPFIKSLNTAVMDEGALNMFSKRSSRLYGFGAAFDPAGLRMAGVLIINAFLFCKAFRENDMTKITLYTLSYVIIVAIGNMIARSTIIGVGISAAMVPVFILQNRPFRLTPAAVLLTGALLVVMVGSFFFLYRYSPRIQASFRFGFEGFFSLFETGKWTIQSNEILKRMIVWPETLQTWIIGDGYCKNPRNDPNFLGEIIGGFYKGTDIGYIRFIFYFGLIGLVMMIGIFIKITVVCIRRLDKSYAILFLFLLVSNLVGWVKVMSDIIMVFAPFLILAFQEAEREDEKLLDPDA